MKIWYFLDSMGRKKGSLNHQKIINLAKGSIVMVCDIADFTGLLLSSDYDG